MGRHFETGELHFFSCPREIVNIFSYEDSWFWSVRWGRPPPKSELRTGKGAFQNLCWQLLLRHFICQKSGDHAPCVFTLVHTTLSLSFTAGRFHDETRRIHAMNQLQVVSMSVFFCPKIKKLKHNNFFFWQIGLLNFIGGEAQCQREKWPCFGELVCFDFFCCQKKTKKQKTKNKKKKVTIENFNLIVTHQTCQELTRLLSISFRVIGMNSILSILLRLLRGEHHTWIELTFQLPFQIR